MIEKRVTKRKVSIAIMILLTFSFIFNIYTVVSMRKYRYKIGLETYSAIESMRFLHDSNIQILSNVIEVGSIDNMGILKLYKNYNDLTEKTADLWSEYIYYEEDRKFILYKKNMEGVRAVIDVNSKIEEFFNEILELEMQTQNQKLELTEDMLKKFKEIYELESEKSSYYNEFCQKNLGGVAQDEKKDIIIKKH